MYLMVKTITIKDDVYRKLRGQKRKNESFSDLFERLSEQNVHSASEVLKKLRASIEFGKSEKESILADIYTKRSERRY
jgi:predicted CopG family antitoxin